MTVSLHDYDTDLSVSQAHPARPGAMMRQKQRSGIGSGSCRPWVQDVTLAQVERIKLLLEIKPGRPICRMADTGIGTLGHSNQTTIYGKEVGC
jgi:hypothetical protein